MNTVSVWWLPIVVFKMLYLTNAKWITGNPCWSMPCMNGGSCFGSTYTYLCICPINYNGILCEKRLGICQENPCSNRGLCVETSLKSFECRCYFGYMGPTCEQHVPKNDSNRWSSLLPVHTRVLFDMLQAAYHARIAGKSSIETDNGQIDFINLLTTTESTLATSMPMTLTTPTVENKFTTHESETTEKEYIIQAQDIRFEEIFSDMTTNEVTEQSSQFDNSTTFLSHPETDVSSSTMIIENMTTIVIEQHQSAFVNTIEDSEIINITDQSNTVITSTPIQWSDDISTRNSSDETDTNVESIVFTTTKPIDFTSANMNIIIDDDMSYSLDQTITPPIYTSEHDTITNAQAAYSQFFYKLCQQMLSHYVPNTSSNASAPDSSSVDNNTADVLLSWLRKHFRPLTTTIETPAVPSLLINDIRTSSVPLQHVDMDDVLHQMNNNIDNEHSS